MAGGGQIGNDNARRGREFRDALRRALKKGAKDRLQKITEKLVAAAEDGEQWAIKEIADRIDGKPTQAIDHSGSIGTYDLSSLTDDQLDRLEQILGPIAIAGGDSGGEGEEGN